MHAMFHAASNKATSNASVPDSRSIQQCRAVDKLHDQNDVITINVGGQRFQTYNSSLLEFPETLLGDIERRAMYLNAADNEYFFNRHRGAFEAILYYYQSKTKELTRPSNVPIHVFLNELIFFDMGEEVIDAFQIEAGIMEVQQIQLKPKWKLFRIIWDFLDDPDSSSGAKLFAIASVVIIVFSLIMFVMETMPEFSEKKVIINSVPVTIPSKHTSWMFKANTAVIVWFTLEYVARLIVSPNKWQFFTSVLNTIDLLSILPYYVSLGLGADNGSLSILRVVRVIRVLRVFKLSRHSRGLQILGNTLKASFNELCMLAFFLFVVILIFGSCVYYAEQSVKGTKFVSIPSSFWWAIVTMTTVGYGDMCPTTLWGQMIGGMAVVCGVLTIALPVPVVVSNFEHFYTKERNRKRMEEARKQAAGSSEPTGVLVHSSKVWNDCVTGLRKAINFKRRRKPKEDSNDNGVADNMLTDKQTRSNGEATYITIEPSPDIEYTSTV